MISTLLPWLGLGAVLTALAGSVWLTVSGWPALLGRPVAAARTARPVYLLVAGATAAMLFLEIGLFTDSFNLSYVAGNHRTGTPLPYTAASAWAALEGSIVLWGLVLAAFIWVFHRTTKNGSAQMLVLRSGALSVLGIIAAFWFGLMATAANPFEVCVTAGEVGCRLAAWAPWSVAQMPVEGQGANPLLQNHFLMIIHPPVLYLGYVGMSVPFAIAIASLAVAGKPLPEESLEANGAGAPVWVKTARRWTLTAWSFLTAGILLGAWWSYEVLGWGGYWAWDPVENASFIPWLLATAFLHSSVVQARRGVLSAWNYVLVIGTFAATILGTFLTRSGVVASVHSFTQSAVGPIILAFLAAVLIGSLVLFAVRVHLVGSAPRLDSLASREGVFLFNNLLLTVFAFVVLAGTLFPLGAEAFGDTTVGVGRPFFDRWAIPLSYALLLAMGLGPITPYRVARPKIVWGKIRTPVLVALAVAALVVVFFTRNRHVIIVTLLAVFVVAVIVTHLISQTRARVRTGGENVGGSLVRLVGNNPGFWGGQMSHIGVAFLAVGIAVSANLVTAGQIDLAPGESTRLAGYEFVYEAPFTRPESNRTVVGARINVLDGGRPVTVLTPALNIYPNSASPIVTPAVHTTVARDLYVSLTRLDEPGLSADVWVYPLQWMIWLGGLLTAAGAGFSLLSIRRAKPAPTTPVPTNPTLSPSADQPAHV